MLLHPAVPPVQPPRATPSVPPTRRLLSLARCGTHAHAAPSAAGYKGSHASAISVRRRLLPASPRHHLLLPEAAARLLLRSSFRSRAAPQIGGGTVEQRRRAREEEDERSQVRLPLPGARLLPGGTVRGAAGDGAAAVRRAAAEEGAELPRRLPGRALLLLLDRRVLLRPFHHLRQLEERIVRRALACVQQVRNNGFSSGSRKKSFKLLGV